MSAEKYLCNRRRPLSAGEDGVIRAGNQMHEEHVKNCIPEIRKVNINEEARTSIHTVSARLPRASDRGD